MLLLFILHIIQHYFQKAVNWLIQNVDILFSICAGFSVVQMVNVPHIPQMQVILSIPDELIKSVFQLATTGASLLLTIWMKKKLEKKSKKKGHE